MSNQSVVVRPGRWIYWISIYHGLLLCVPAIFLLTILNFGGKSYSGWIYVPVIAIILAST